MTRLTAAAWASAAGLALILPLTLPTPVLAQTAAAKSSAPKKAAPARKATARTPAPPPEPPIEIAPADEAQFAAAKLVYLGDYQCELRKSLTVTPDTEHEGYMAVQYASQRFLVKPVLSSTGAVRLEDVRGRGLMVQIAQKSMLLDVRQGARLADECVSAQQAENRRIVAQAAEEAATAASAAAIAATAAAAAASSAIAAAAAASAAAAITVPAPAASVPVAPASAPQ